MSKEKVFDKEYHREQLRLKQTLEMIAKFLQQQELLHNTPPHIAAISIMNFQHRVGWQIDMLSDVNRTDQKLNLITISSPKQRRRVKLTNELEADDYV